jgi:hypothetical protein
MLIAIVALALQDKDPGPIALPPGSSAVFQTSVQMVQEAVSAGDWDEARRLADRLPSYDLKLEWDDSGLTGQQKTFFARARDEAMVMAKEWVPKLRMELGRPGGIKVSFATSLPPNADSPGPAGAVHMFSPAAGDPVIESVWALVRGEDKRPTDVMEIKNELYFLVGSYFGLARLPRPGSVMYRQEEQYFTLAKWSFYEARLIERIVETSDRIRKSVAEKKDPGYASPEIFVTPGELTPQPVTQNSPMKMSIQVTNRGKGALNYMVVPDCGCFGIDSYDSTLEPGETTIVPIAINTLDFVGRLSKNLYVYSNDPEQPIKRIPLMTTVRPAYRFVNVKDDPAIIVGDDGATFETVLVVEDGVDFKVNKVAVSGVMAAVTFDAWTGTLDNPEAGEGPKKRKGYLITALIGPGFPAGRTTMQFTVETDHPVFKSLYHQINAQNGIVAVPLSIYFGSIGNEPARASVVITRPGRPYKIKKVVSDVSFITPSVEPYRGETEYKIVATYNGKAPIGRFLAQIEVHTDDPKQPIVYVPIEGTVR